MDIKNTINQYYDKILYLTNALLIIIAAGMITITTETTKTNWGIGIIAGIGIISIKLHNDRYNKLLRTYRVLRNNNPKPNQQPNNPTPITTKTEPEDPFNEFNNKTKT